MYCQSYGFPIGTIHLFESEGCISGLYFKMPEKTKNCIEKETPLLKMAHSQLNQYFSGERKIFDLPLVYHGTPFQIKVWDALKTIPYGMTVTYGEIAAQIGCPKAFRAVGNANNHNPVSIIVPCHRVIGANGKLVGYGGGLENKVLLLSLEEKHKNADAGMHA